MKTRSHLLIILPAALTLSHFLPNVALAQFKKFQSSSRFNAPAMPNNAAPGPQAETPPQNKPGENFDEFEDDAAMDDSGMDPVDYGDMNAAGAQDPAASGDNLKAFQDSGSNYDSQAFGNRNTQPPAAPGSNKYVNLNPETSFGPEIITSFDFPDADILDLTKHMQKLTGINLILDKDVKGKVSITAPTPITVGDAWKAYLTALDMSGFSIIKSGAFYRIISSRDIRYAPSKMYTGSYTPETDAQIMKVIAIKHVSASEIAQTFRPFMSRNGRLMEIKQTNTIIASDTGTHVARLERLIKFVDVPGHDESLQIIPVKNSSAQEIAKLIDEILNSKGTNAKNGGARTTLAAPRFGSSSSGGSSSQNISKIIAEPRTNSIIAMANAEGARQLRELIAKLDVQRLSTGSGRLHVYYLNYGNAEELAKTLSTLISGASVADKGGANKKFVPAGEGAEAIFNSDVKITSDKNNNAIVVTATPTDWMTLKSVIAKLDIPRDQVYVEGMILETSIKNKNEAGVEWFGISGSGNANRFGFTNGATGPLGSMLGTGNPVPLSGLFGGVSGGKSYEVEIGGKTQTISSVNGLIKAIASQSNTNIFATPQIMAMDNVDAEFEVGKTEPITNQTMQGNVTTQSFAQQEAKLSLKITPQINKVTRFVTLKIKQNINDFDADAASVPGRGRPTTTRAAVTEVMVRDQDTIAMGGLLRDKIISTTNKVPLLGDIPVLGWLFKNRTSEIEKVNLLFFMTPRIISPYKTAAANSTMDIIEKRKKHLAEGIQNSDNKDYHADTMQKVTDKVIKQSKGPLYDIESSDELLQNNNAEEFNARSETPSAAPVETKPEETKSQEKEDTSVENAVETTKAPEPTPAESINNIESANAGEAMAPGSTPVLPPGTEFTPPPEGVEPVNYQSIIEEVQKEQ